MKTLLPAASCILGILAATPAAMANLNQATVTRVVNSVEVIPSGQQPKAATIGEVVSGGSDVRTGGNSRAQLTFPDNTLARLGANTLFSFERGTRSLDLESGAILLQVPRNAGGATIRSAPVIAAITGTTVMMEYSPGNPGVVKIIVLEGTVRLSLAGRLGESVLVGPGQMLAVAANATALPNPVYVDLKRILKTSRLIKDGELESMGLIMEAVDAQQGLISDGKLYEHPPDLTPQSSDPSLIAASIANSTMNRRDTVQQPAAPPPPPPPAAPAPPPQPSSSPYYPPCYGSGT